MVDDYDGVIPSDPAILEKSIPGIGRYSAGAISSIAYGAQAPVVSRFTYWPSALRSRMLTPISIQPIQSARAPSTGGCRAERWSLNGPSIDGRFFVRNPRRIDR